MSEQLHAVIDDDQLQMAQTNLSRIGGELNRAAYIPDEEHLDIITASVGLESAILIEGPVGTGKSTIAKAIARIIGGTNGRVQGSPDLTASAILGASIYNPHTGKFDFQPGPIFSNVYFNDEINRQPTKTQSALLQGMQEREVSITSPGENGPRALPSPFLVIATQNPNEIGQGTYPLPKAATDRFNVRINQKPFEEKDYAAVGAKQGVIANQRLELSDLPQMKVAIESLEVTPAAQERCQRLLPVLRELEIVDAGLSMLAGFRGYNETMRFAKALALMSGKHAVRANDIDQAAQYTLPHRIEISYGAMDDDSITPEIAIHQALERL